jgi:foldase protein PrsA
VATVVDARPAALVNGRSILWGEMAPALSEAAGGITLEEIILERGLRERIEKAGIVITAADIQAEQRRVLDTLSDDPTTALRLLDELRDRQRLGPNRFEGLLQRNAMMRALIRDQVSVDEPAVAQMHDAVHGAKRQVRLVTTRDLATAESVRRRVRDGAFLGDLAVELSTDASAPRGGLLEPVSRRDPSYPAALRQAIWSLSSIGDVSDPVLLDNGYALVQLVGEVDADGVALAEVRDDLRRLVRLRQERVLMDRLARDILSNPTVTIFDPSLNDAWRRHRRRR